MGRRSVLTLGSAAVLALAPSCYLSHERALDGGRASERDAVELVERCDPAHRDPDACWPHAHLHGTFDLDGVPTEFCFCAPGTCGTHRIEPGCRVFHLAGDTEELRCADPVPLNDLGGYCLRECVETTDCPEGMACLPVSEALGYSFDMNSACFDVVSP